MHLLRLKRCHGCDPTACLSGVHGLTDIVVFGVGTLQTPVLDEMRIANHELWATTR
jgi:hypothetical protein